MAEMMADGVEAGMVLRSAVVVATHRSRGREMMN